MVIIYGTFIISKNYRTFRRTGRKMGRAVPCFSYHVGNDGHGEEEEKGYHDGSYNGNNNGLYVPNGDGDSSEMHLVISGMVTTLFLDVAVPVHDVGARAVGVALLPGEDATVG